MANYSEIFNPDRIEIDEMLDKFGPKAFMATVQSICAEKAKETSRPYDERLAFEDVTRLTFKVGVDIADVDDVVNATFDYHGGGAILKSLIKRMELIGETSNSQDLKKQCKRAVEALQLKTVRDSWGL